MLSALLHLSVAKAFKFSSAFLFLFFWSLEQYKSQLGFAQSLPFRVPLHVRSCKHSQICCVGYFGYIWLSEIFSFCVFSLSLSEKNLPGYNSEFRFWTCESYLQKTDCVEEQFKLLLLTEDRWLLAMTSQMYGNCCWFGFGLLGAFCMLCWGRGSVGKQRETEIMEWGLEPVE